MIKIYTVGKLRNPNIKLEISELIKRISKIEIIELKEIKHKNIEIIKNKEAELFDKFIDKSNYNILLSENGKQLNTFEFSEKLNKLSRNVCFFITGPYGISDKIKYKFDYIFSLSKMIFTHEQAQYLLIEQIYRHDCFNKNINYTK